MSKPFVLIILDGWGIAPDNRGNAIRLASTPVFDRLTTTYPTMAIQAAGEAVGLPWGEMGNSEVGHLNIGAGKIVYQDLPRITKAISDGSFFSNEAFRKAVEHVQKHRSRLHFAGLVSSGGIHSFHEHLYALLEFAAQQKITNVYIHAFLDGRDTPYNSAKNFLAKLLQECAKNKVGRIATLSGRYFAMDRDRHWDRTAIAYHAMVDGQGAMASDPLSAIEESYAHRVYDEEFVPTVILDEKKQPVAKVGTNDAIIFFNFRNDRMRQLTKAFVLPDFHEFPRPPISGLFVVTMTEYEPSLPVTLAFPPDYIAQPLAKILSDRGLKQLHIAETEKYAHVTFFLNGGREEEFPGEKRVLIPSPSVATYDQKPEMSARTMTDRLVGEITKGKYDFLAINFANADMVGHTGNMPAIIKAIETLDSCLGRLVDATLALDGTALITADHGNAEEAMNLQTGVLDKEHSANPVPFIVVGRAWAGKGTLVNSDLSNLTPTGFLADVAPTILKLMGIPQPASMTGRPLIQLTH